MARRKIASSRATWSSAVATLCVALAPVAVAAEITYAGNWECEATPKLTIPNFSAPGTVVREGNRLAVSRTVYRPGTYEEVGRVSGTTTAQDGKFVGETATPSGGITGRFEGTVSDAEVALKGVDRLKIPDRGEGERDCRATLKRR
jgi:hypothetical protein